MQVAPSNAEKGVFFFVWQLFQNSIDWVECEIGLGARVCAHRQLTSTVIKYVQSCQARQQFPVEIGWRNRPKGPTKLWPMLIGRTSSVNICVKVQCSGERQATATNCGNNEILTKVKSSTQQATQQKWWL